MTNSNPFPASDFDGWAETYDRDTDAYRVFPFAGYERALDTVVELAAPEAGMSVLDLGTGTGNLALRFAEFRCKLWCTDFSEVMLQKAREKLPTSVQLVLHDLNAAWPPELDRRFDRIVSAYVFHHFDLSRKVALARELVQQHLNPGGALILADVSFRDAPTMHQFAESIGELWEEEPYWLADQAVAALAAANLNAEYAQVSDCAGVYRIEEPGGVRAED